MQIFHNTLTKYHATLVMGFVLSNQKSVKTKKRVQVKPRDSL